MFAVDNEGSIWAIVAVIVANIVQSLFKEWRDWRAAKTKRKEDAKATAELKDSLERKAQEVKDALVLKQKEEEDSRKKLEQTSEQSLSVNTENKVALDETKSALVQVYNAVNGNGLGAAVKNLADRQTVHESRLEKMETKLDCLIEAVHNNVVAVHKLTEAPNDLPMSPVRQDQATT